jgi:hypothetical protein
MYYRIVSTAFDYEFGYDDNFRPGFRYVLVERLEGGRGAIDFPFVAPKLRRPRAHFWFTASPWR